MKKLVSLAIALFLAVTAAAQTSQESEVITQQVLSGELIQTVYAGDEIEPVTIFYDNIVGGVHQSEGLLDLGLVIKWNGSRCEVSGEINSDHVADTVKAYILVQDAEGKYAKTEFTFIVKEKPISLEWNDGSGPVDQAVKAGASIAPITFDYEGITTCEVIGLPSGLTKTIDETRQKIKITGAVASNVTSGEYVYKVVVKNDQGTELVKSGTITVEGGKARTSIKLFSDNTSQEVLAGNEIEPVVFEFANVRVDESLSSFKFEGSLKGSFAYSVEGSKLTCSGTVDKNSLAGLYTIRIIAIGENNNDTAFANVEVTRESVESSSSVAASSSSVAASSSSEASSSSSAESGSSAEPPSSSSNIEESSSSEKTTEIVAVAMNTVKFGYANNVLTVAMPNSAILRVQVFDMMGHLVESFAETEASSKSISLAHLTKGNYVVRIESARSVRTARILVK